MFSRVNMECVLWQRGKGKGRLLQTNTSPPEYLMVTTIKVGFNQINFRKSSMQHRCAILYFTSFLNYILICSERHYWFRVILATTCVVSCTLQRGVANISHDDRSLINTRERV